jgi:hypothetical protein
MPPLQITTTARHTVPDVPLRSLTLDFNQWMDDMVLAIWLLICLYAWCVCRAAV